MTHEKSRSRRWTPLAAILATTLPAPELVTSLAVVDTDTDAYAGPIDKNLGRTGVVLGVKYNF